MTEIIMAFALGTTFGLIFGIVTLQLMDEIWPPPENGEETENVDVSDVVVRFRQR